MNTTRRTLRLETLKSRTLLAVDCLRCLDINNDGEINPTDALFSVNQGNESGAGPIGQTRAPRTDINNDGWFTPSDIGTVINFLNNEGPTTTPEHPIGDLHLFEMFESDLLRSNPVPAGSSFIVQFLRPVHVGNRQHLENLESISIRVSNPDAIDTLQLLYDDPFDDHLNTINDGIATVDNEVVVIPLENAVSQDFNTMLLLARSSATANPEENVSFEVVDIVTESRFPLGNLEISFTTFELDPPAGGHVTISETSLETTTATVGDDVILNQGELTFTGNDHGISLLDFEFHGLTVRDFENYTLILDGWFTLDAKALPLGDSILEIDVNGRLFDLGTGTTRYELRATPLTSGRISVDPIDTSWFVDLSLNHFYDKGSPLEIETLDEAIEIIARGS